MLLRLVKSSVGQSRRRYMLSLVAVCAGILGIMVGVASARHASSSHSKGSSSVTRRVHSRLPFAVLTRPIAHKSQQSVAGLRGAVFAQSGGGREVFVWQGLRSEAATPYSLSMHGNSDQICLISQGPPSTSGQGRADGGVCAPASAAAKTGIIDIAETGSNLYRRVTVLAPNGVKQVTFTDRDGTSYNVEVKDNVVINTDQTLAQPPATAVSFTLPDGAIESASMPLPPTPPQQP